MKRVSRVMLACCVAMAVTTVTSGCGDNADPIEEPEPPPPPPPEPGPCDGELTLEQFGECFNGAYVARVLDCGLGELGDVDPDNVGAALIGAGFDPQSIADILVSIAAGRVDFDGAAAQACYQQLIAASCVELLVGGDNEDVLAQCDTLLVPRVADGDACGANYECDDGDCRGTQDYWEIGTACDPAGECIARAAVGESCNDANCTEGSSCEDFDNNSSYFCEAGDEGDACNQYSCDSGLYCEFPLLLAGIPQPVLGICTPREIVAEGGACGYYGEAVCEAGTLCLPVGPKGSGLCVKSDAEGDPCNFTCNNGLACVVTYDNAAHLTAAAPSLGTCTADIPGVGDECLANGFIGEFGPCGAFLDCQSNGPNEAPTCENRGGEGTACSSNFDFLASGGPSGDCRLDLFCSDEIVLADEPSCMAPQPAGAFCTEAYHCAEGYCNASGLCGPAVACAPEFD